MNLIKKLCRILYKCVHLLWRFIKAVARVSRHIIVTLYKKIRDKWYIILYYRIQNYIPVPGGVKFIHKPAQPFVPVKAQPRAPMNKEEKKHIFEVNVKKSVWLSRFEEKWHDYTIPENIDKIIHQQINKIHIQNPHLTKTQHIHTFVETHAKQRNQLKTQLKKQWWEAYKKRERVWLLAFEQNKHINLHRRKPIDSIDPVYSEAYQRAYISLYGVKPQNQKPTKQWWIINATKKNTKVKPNKTNKK